MKEPFSITNDGYIVLGINGYDYINDTNAMKMMLEYKKVILASDFNSSIDFLPSEITHLVLGKSFNQEINNLPSGLKSLKIIGDECNYSEFSKSLDSLPHGLEELILYARLNNVYIGNNLPQTLKTLVIVYFGIGMLTTKIDFNTLPDNIEYIKCHTHHLNNIDNKLPTNLKRIETEYLDKDKIESLQTRFPNVIFHNKNI